MKLYIDPGTGSMLFAAIIGLATTGVFAFKGIYLKMKQRISGGKVEVAEEKIPLVIFSDHKRYWNVFQPICDELERREISCEFWTMSSDDPALSCPYEFVKCRFIGEGNKAFAKLNMMNAKVCLSTTPGLDVFQWKRSKNVETYIHIYHSLDDGTVYRMFALDFYDAVMLTGPLQEQPIRALEEMRHLKSKELILAGSPFMDSLQKRAEGTVRSQPDVSKQKTVLCAPSWGESSLLNKYGESFIDAVIATGYDVIIRPHPQSFTSDAELMDKLQQKYPNNDHFQWNRDNDNFEVLSRADIMISDFSAVIFDYSLIFDRPIIYTDTEFDPAPYDAAWFDELPWTVRCMGTIGKKLSKDDFPKMKAVIDEVISDDRYAEGRAKAKELLWSHQGSSAVKAVDYLEKMITAL